MLNALFKLFNQIGGWLGRLLTPLSESTSEPSDPTIQQRLQMGHSLANAFSLGADLEPQSDDWTTEKLIRLSNSLSHIHPGL